jgi:hypothetical protein
MRSLGFVGAIGLVVGLGVPAFAGDKNTPELFAVSQLSTHGTLQVMTDKQLTTVEGMSYKRHHGYHYGPINQSNELSQYNVNQGCGCGKWHDSHDGKGNGYYHGGEVYQDNFAEQLNSVYHKHGSVDQSNWADQMNANAGGHYVEQANGASQYNTVGLPPMVR